MKHLLKNLVSLIIERRPVLPPLAVAVVLTGMPAFAQGAAQAPSPAVAAQTEQLPAGFAEKSATVNGVRINYKIGGQGPAVVLLHGYAENKPYVAAPDAAARHKSYRDRSRFARRR